MSPQDNVIHLSDARAGRSPEYPVINFFDRVAPTGSFPLLGRASDGKFYWCKTLVNNHGPESVVNEVVASVIGQAINAPVTPWSIVRIPDELDGVIIGTTRRVYAGLAFGSENIHTSDLDRMDPEIPNVHRDGNVNRVPQLLALWVLCNALDKQVLFDADKDYQIWSVDHGFWFGSHPMPWGMAEMSGFPEIDRKPSLRTSIPQECWQRAIEDLNGLDEDVITASVAAVPSEWGIETAQVEELVRFAIDRKPMAIEELQRFQSRQRRR